MIALLKSQKQASLTYDIGGYESAHLCVGERGQ